MQEVANAGNAADVGQRDPFSNEALYDLSAVPAKKESPCIANYDAHGSEDYEACTKQAPGDKAMLRVGTQPESNAAAEDDKKDSFTARADRHLQVEEQAQVESTAVNSGAQPAKTETGADDAAMAEPQDEIKVKTENEQLMISQPSVHGRAPPDVTEGPEAPSAESELATDFRQAEQQEKLGSKASGSGPQACEQNPPVSADANEDTNADPMNAMDGPVNVEELGEREAQRHSALDSATDREEEQAQELAGHDQAVQELPLPPEPVLSTALAADTDEKVGPGDQQEGGDAVAINSGAQPAKTETGAHDAAMAEPQDETKVKTENEQLMISQPSVHGRAPPDVTEGPEAPSAESELATDFRQAEQQEKLGSKASGSGPQACEQNPPVSADANEDTNADPVDVMDGPVNVEELGEREAQRHSALDSATDREEEQAQELAGHDQAVQELPLPPEPVLSTALAADTDEKVGPGDQQEGGDAVAINSGAQPAKTETGADDAAMAEPQDETKVKTENEQLPQMISQPSVHGRAPPDVTEGPEAPSAESELATDFRQAEQQDKPGSKASGSGPQACEQNPPISADANEDTNADPMNIMDGPVNVEELGERETQRHSALDSATDREEEQAQELAGHDQAVQELPLPPEPVLSTALAADTDEKVGPGDQQEGGDAVAINSGAQPAKTETGADDAAMAEPQDETKVKTENEQLPQMISQPSVHGRAPPDVTEGPEAPSAESELATDFRQAEQQEKLGSKASGSGPQACEQNPPVSADANEDTNADPMDVMDGPVNVEELGEREAQRHSALDSATDREEEQAQELAGHDQAVQELPLPPEPVLSTALAADTDEKVGPGDQQEGGDAVAINSGAQPAKTETGADDAAMAEPQDEIKVKTENEQLPQMISQPSVHGRAPPDVTEGPEAPNAKAQLGMDSYDDEVEAAQQEFSVEEFPGASREGTGDACVKRLAALNPPNMSGQQDPSRLSRLDQGGVLGCGASRCPLEIACAQCFQVRRCRLWISSSLATMARLPV